jgi:hypothetical protein
MTGGAGEGEEASPHEEGQGGAGGGGIRPRGRLTIHRKVHLHQESNAKCHYLKNLPVNGLCGMCLSV